jgi:extradiol dioxygenase family protein
LQETEDSFEVFVTLKNIVMTPAKGKIFPEEQWKRVADKTDGSKLSYQCMTIKFKKEAGEQHQGSGCGGYQVAGARNR